MKDYAINENVPSEDIFMDHAGFETYDTMYRAKKCFWSKKKVVIVTQKISSIQSTLYCKRKVGLDAYGVPAI